MLFRSSVLGVARKIENDLDATLNTFKAFDSSMKKGSSSILESEIIVAKLMYGLRFLDKLSPDVREKILNMNEFEIDTLNNMVLNSKGKETMSPSKKDNPYSVFQSGVGDNK